MSDGHYFKPLEGETMFRASHRRQDEIHRLEKVYQHKGYEDALHGKCAASVNAVYQAAYRRGLERLRELRASNKGV